MKVLIIFSILFSLYLSDYIYDVYQANGETCNQVSLDRCYTCDSYGFYIYPYSDGTVKYYNYSSGCYSGITQFIDATKGSCNSLNTCGVYYTSQYVEYSLNIESTHPLSASFIFSTDDTYISIAEYNATVTGDIFHIFIESDGNLFQVIKSLSSSKYLCNFGAREFNTQYSDGFFTYTVSKNILNEKPSYEKNTLHIAEFYPFTNVEVKPNSNKELSVLYSDVQLYVYLSNIEDINDIYIANPYFRLTNLDLYPPYSTDSDLGTLVFQFQSNSNYHAFPCEYEESSAVLYYCEFSLSSEIPLPFRDFSFSGSFFDSSIIQEKTVDEMAFQLF